MVVTEGPSWARTTILATVRQLILEFDMQVAQPSLPPIGSPWRTRPFHRQWLADQANGLFDFFQRGIINPNGVKLTYDPGPKDGQVNKPIGVKVHATGTGLTPWEGLLIQIKAQDNNGKFVAVTPDQATTDALGIADFSNSKINKAGVYQLLAYTVPTDDLAGFTPDSLLSGNFLQRPK